MKIFCLPFIIAALLWSCDDSFFKPLHPAKIEIMAPVQFNGVSGVLYDTLWLKLNEEPNYNFRVRFSKGENQDGFNPTVSFDGSGSSQFSGPLESGQIVEVNYNPKSEGQHPILFFWDNNPCGYYPKEKIILFLYVTNEIATKRV
jgi:hypothetical protein